MTETRPRPAATLILGGARSGKSAAAQRLAQAHSGPVTFVATAQALDDGMARRIARHQEERPPHWGLVEEPLALAGTLVRLARPDGLLLVDCLTLWLSNLLHHADPERWPTERDALLACLPRLPGEVILVSNEIGLGVVPLGELTRRFVDELGWLHQSLAARCQRVLFTVAGLPMVLKGPPLAPPVAEGER